MEVGKCRVLTRSLVWLLSRVCGEGDEAEAGQAAAGQVGSNSILFYNFYPYDKEIVFYLIVWGPLSGIDFGNSDSCLSWSYRHDAMK